MLAFGQLIDLSLSPGTSSLIIQGAQKHGAVTNRAAVTFDETTCSASKWKGLQAYDVKEGSCFKAQSPLFKLTFKSNTCNFKLLNLLRMGNTASKTLDENITSIINPCMIWCNWRFCGFSSNWILHYFPPVRSSVRHRRDISHFSHI